MTTSWRLFLCLPFIHVVAFSPFANRASTRRNTLMRRTRTSTCIPLNSRSERTNRDSSDNGDADALERKMALVRSLQSAYYQSTNSELTVGLEKETGILRNLPLWRVQWTELPGRSNVLNVHEGTYTNMFETILRGPKPWYVGHLFLPGGSKNLKSAERGLQLKTWREEGNEDEVADGRDRRGAERSAVVGTLLRISDFRRLADGRLILLVQAVERFVVDWIVQTLPYGIADVQILPDFDATSIKENGDEEARAQRVSEVMDSFRYLDYEYDAEFALPLAESQYLSATVILGPEIAKVLPFVPYSKSFQLSSDHAECIEGQPAQEPSSSDMPSFESRLLDGSIVRSPSFLSDKGASLSTDGLEDQLWTAMEDFCRASRIALPEEVLRLVPRHRSWLTPVSEEQRLSPEYPSDRRQRRLSFASSAFLEQTRVGADMRQVWLETPSTKERLRAVLERFEIINNLFMGEYQ